MSNESNGMLADFELAVTHLLSACPVASKVAKNSNNAQIYGLGGNFKRAPDPRLVWNFDTTRHLSLPISVTYVNERKLDGTTIYLLQEHIENAGNAMWILRMYMIVCPP